MSSQIKTIYGDLLTERPNSVIIHGCNCQGVMGSGVALAVKNKYPVVYDEYVSLCNAYQPTHLLGSIQIESITEDEYPNFLINGFTQLDFGAGRQVNYDAIYEVFERTNEFMRMSAIDRTLYFPKIGACRGGGNWRIISTIIEETVDQRFNPTLVEYKPT